LSRRDNQNAARLLRDNYNATIMPTPRRQGSHPDCRCLPIQIAALHRLLVRATREESAEFGLLVETLALTGARVSQLARCQIRDLVGERLMIPSRAKGQNKRASRTPAPIRWRSPIGCG